VRDWGARSHVARAAFALSTRTAQLFAHWAQFAASRATHLLAQNWIARRTAALEQCTAQGLPLVSQSSLGLSIPVELAASSQSRGSSARGDSYEIFPPQEAPLCKTWAPSRGCAAASKLQRDSLRPAGRSIIDQRPPIGQEVSACRVGPAGSRFSRGRRLLSRSKRPR